MLRWHTSQSHGLISDAQMMNDHALYLQVPLILQKAMLFVGYENIEHVQQTEPKIRNFYRSTFWLKIGCALFLSLELHDAWKS